MNKIELGRTYSVGAYKNYSCSEMETYEKDSDTRVMLLTEWKSVSFKVTVTNENEIQNLEQAIYIEGTRENPAHFFSTNYSNIDFEAANDGEGPTITNCWGSGWTEETETTFVAEFETMKNNENYEEWMESKGFSLVSGYYSISGGVVLETVE